MQTVPVFACESEIACNAALNSGRDYVGYDIKSGYVELSNKGISQCSEQVDMFDMVSRYWYLM